MATENDVKKTVKDMKDDFMSLGLKYNMGSFEFCADNDIDLSECRSCKPKHVRILVQVGIDGHNKVKADEVIASWIEKGYSFQMLGVMCLQEAKKSGFFTLDEEIQMIPQLVQRKEDMMMFAPMMLDFVGDQRVVRMLSQK